MYTDPKRLKASDPGTVDNNPLWVFHETFNPDQAWVSEAKERYRHGQIGDVECKKKLLDVLVAFIEPMRLRRLAYEKNLDFALQVLREGSEKATAVSNETATLAKAAMKQLYW
jgi:tryptophanyl-tRNA synthetase